MSFVLIEEWSDKENPYKYYNVPVFAGAFDTKQEADEEAKKHKPQHGGIIRAVPDQQETKTVQRRKGTGRKKPRLRETRRGSSRH